MNGRERLLAHLRGEEVDCLPFMPMTMMFAADLVGQPYGRYATDYRILAEGQIRMSEMFDTDYVNTMSDPAIEASDCGADIRYFEDQPPAINDANALLADPTRLLRLKKPDPHTAPRMHNRIQGIALLKERIGKDKVVEGWVEGPCAEGADLRGINILMTDFIDDPRFVRDLFEFVIDMELDFARAQVQAGADMIGVGDAAASLVGPRVYREFVFEYEKKLVDGIKAMGVPVRLHICGNTRRVQPELGRLGFDIVDLDFLVPMEEGRAGMGPDQIILGNIDPVRELRNSTPAKIAAAIERCHHIAGDRFIVSAGCEVPRDTAHENVRTMGRYAREHKPSDFPVTTP